MHKLLVFMCLKENVKSDVKIIIIIIIMIIFQNSTKNIWNPAPLINLCY